MIRLLHFAILCILFHGAKGLAQERIPKFTDHAARVIHTRRSVKIRLHSTPDTACFRTRLRDTVLGGQLFAGHYVLGYWGCGTCIRVGIIDLLTGRAYVSPYMVSSAQGVYKVKPNSRLLVVDDAERDGSFYFLWTGRHLLPINNGQVERREPERMFKTCSEITRSQRAVEQFVGPERD
jgi:hypothetical protein